MTSFINSSKVVTGKLLWCESFWRSWLLENNSLHASNSNSFNLGHEEESALSGFSLT